MLHEAADGRQSTVPRYGSIAPFGFDVVQKRQYGFRLNIVELQVRDLFTLPSGQKRKNSVNASRYARTV